MASQPDLADLVFIDTEFTDLQRPQLVSIGMVCGAQELYLELDGVDPRDCSAFVRETVLPLLEGGARRRTDDQARDEAFAWLSGLGRNVTCVSDAPGFDFEFLRALLGGRWPANLSRSPHKFHPSAIVDEDIRGFVSEALRPGRPHHALDDARALKAAWEVARSFGWKP